MPFGSSATLSVAAAESEEAPPSHDQDYERGHESPHTKEARMEADTVGPESQKRSLEQHQS